MAISTLLTTAKQSNAVAEEGVTLITDSTGTLDVATVIVFSWAGCTLIGRIAVVVDPDTHKIVSINYSSLGCTVTHIFNVSQSERMMVIPENLKG